MVSSSWAAQGYEVCDELDQMHGFRVGGWSLRHEYSFRRLMLTFFFKTVPLVVESSYSPFPRSWCKDPAMQSGSIFPPFLCFCYIHLCFQTTPLFSPEAPGVDAFYHIMSLFVNPEQL